MIQHEPGKTDRPRHFLFHIFASDNAAHPMPPRRAESLLALLRRAFAEAAKNNQRRE